MKQVSILAHESCIVTLSTRVSEQSKGLNNNRNIVVVDRSMVLVTYTNHLPRTYFSDSSSKTTHERHHKLIYKTFV